MEAESEPGSVIPGSGLEPGIAERAARLRQAVTDAGGPTAVAARSRVNLGTLNTYLRGRDMKVETLVQLAAATGVRLEWLAAGAGPMRAGDPAPSPAQGLAEGRTAADPAALGLTWQADPDRLARAYELALQGLVTLPGHRPDPRRLMQITLLIYDEMTAAEQAAKRSPAPSSEPPKSP
jgi:transcriptional regulator with XRE-family HTH domain